MTDLQEKIKNIIEQLTKLLLDKMIVGDIDDEEGQEIAQYILAEKRKVVDDSGFDQFLKNVNERYPLFAPVIENFQKKVKVDDADQQKLTEIKSQLSKLIVN